MPKEFKGLRLNRDKIVPSLESSGATDFSVNIEPNGNMVLTGMWKEAKFRVNVYLKGDGTTTLGHASGWDRAAFEAVASILEAGCAYAAQQKFEVSVKLPEAQVNELWAFLAENKAEQVAEEDIAHGRRLRWRGKDGDTLAVTVFNTGTAQFQGRNLHLASLVWDYLTNVLSLDTVLEKQIATYKVPVSVAEIKDELASKLPVAFPRLHEEVRKQLSCALTWTKVDVELEDYSNVAFPALRGLEGFLYQEIAQCGLHPAEKGNFGDYFDVNGQLYSVREPYAEHLAGEKGVLLAQAYGLYHKQRHGLAHMSVLLVGTRTLESMAEAIDVIKQVFEQIENFYQKVK
jgi:hypothetical protein